MMKKLGIILGAAAVAIVSGCKDPNYIPPKQRGQAVVKPSKPVTPKEDYVSPSEVKPVAPENHVVEIVVEPAGCQCLPGAKHAEPCKCGASDCKCVVEPPAKPAPVKTTPAPAEETTTYIIQPNDTLGGIAQKYNLKKDDIKRLNAIKDENKICVGNKLKLPGKVDVGPQTVPPASRAQEPKAAPKPFVPYTGDTKVYVVKGGDNLGKIASASNISTKQLIELNALKSDKIIPGQKLKVPASAQAKSAEAPAAKSASVEPKAKSTEKKTPAPTALTQDPATPVEPVVEPVKEEKVAPPPAVENYETYVVAPGEDIIGIALSYGIEPSEIRALNKLGDADQVRAGQTIKLPKEGN